MQCLNLAHADILEKKVYSEFWKLQLFLVKNVINWLCCQGDNLNGQLYELKYY